ncbi:MAG: glutamate mutase L [Anaerolineales bacterium]
MTTSIVDADSLLAIDVGTVTTRAGLFDVVDGSYRFMAIGTAPTTLDAPYKDISEGVRMAIDQLQLLTGRAFIGIDEDLIVPSTPEGTGVDSVVATLSAGEPFKVVVVGLLEDISLQSARNLAATIYARVVDAISMNDRRKIEAKIDAILRSRPDLILVAGGTEDGASKSVLTLLEAVGLACYLLPEDQRPRVLFAGNPGVAADVEESLTDFALVQIAPNIRPSLETEQLSPAQGKLREIFRDIRSASILGVDELNKWVSGRLMPSTMGFSRVIRFLSQVYDSNKGVLGVDLGASSTTVAAAFAGDLKHQVYTQLGLGTILPNLLNYTSPSNIARWLSVDVSESDIQGYIYHKAVYPSSLPVTSEELGIEQAIAREILRTAIKGTRKRFPANAAQSRPDLLPWFEPIIASGNVLTNASSWGQSMLMLLDALEPTGISTIVLDQYNIFSALGAAAEINPTLTVQVFESGALTNLGTVIAPVGRARSGTEILRVRVTYESGQEKKFEVTQGSLKRIPLPAGQGANLHLQPLHRYDVGMGGAGRGGGLDVRGGELGIIIDARGRPLGLPSDPAKRRDLILKWSRALER